MPPQDLQTPIPCIIVIINIFRHGRGAEGELRSDGGLAHTRPHNTLHLRSGSLACILQSDTNKLYFDAALLEFGAFMGMGIGEGLALFCCTNQLHIIYEFQNAIIALEYWMPGSCFTDLPIKLALSLTLHDGNAMYYPC